MLHKYIGPAALVTALSWSSGADAQRCGNGGWRVGDLGFDTFKASLSMDERDGNRPRYQFRSEVEIGDVQPGGPAAGRLRDGDVIAAIDGQLITTAAAGRRFSALNPGDVVRLSIRRDGRMQDVSIRAGARCTPVGPDVPAPPVPPRPPRPATAAAPAPPPVPGVPGRPPVPPVPPRAGVPAAPPRPPAVPRAGVPAPPAPPAAPGTPAAPPVPPAPPAPPAPPEIMPDGWFGFGIQCRNCGIQAPRGQAAVFRFGEAPTVVNVEPGTPAAGAGMRRGDRLTHVDGVSLTTRAGWRRFGSIQPGQRVAWTFTRGGRRQQATLTALRRPDAGRAPAAPASPQAQRLRYSGSAGGAQVEVRGAPVNVTTDPRTGEMVIRSADITVRIRPQGRR